MRSLAALILLTCLAGFSFAHVPSTHAAAQAVSARHDIQHVIAAQIEAFRRNDGAAALTYATPALQAKFEDGPHFLEMVRIAYPSVFRPRSFTFTALTEDAGAMLQKVELVGPAGETAMALYELQREHSGTWRIAGCTLAKSEQIDI